MKALNSAPVQIRPARPEDIGKLCEYAGELLQKWDARANVEDARRVYEHILQSPQLGIILVAEHADGLCGFAYASYDWRSEYGGETMDLVEMSVEHSWRNHGVGRTLLEGLIVQAKRRNIHRFTCQVHPGN